MNYGGNDRASLQGRKATYMAAMIAPTKRTPNVFPRDVRVREGCEDIAGYRKMSRDVWGRLIGLYMAPKVKQYHPNPTS